MNRSRAIELLSRSKPALAARYAVTRLALFGSTVQMRSLVGMSAVKRLGASNTPKEIDL